MAIPIYNGPPQADLHTLSNADGSATYTEPGSTYKIIAGVNYPVEVPYRSDEIPESTFIDVILRPHNGVGMVKERHVEQLVKRTLQTLVLGEETPRTMLQATLQVVGSRVTRPYPVASREEGKERHISTSCHLPSMLQFLVVSMRECRCERLRAQHSWRLIRIIS